MSSSDEEEIAPRRKRNARVIGEEEGSGDEDESSSEEESGSSSEDGSAEENGDESEWEEIPQELLLEGCQQPTSHSTAETSAKKSLPSPALVADSSSRGAGGRGEESDDSDLSDMQAERCAVCLNRFLGQEVGTPESCDHAFCLDCIQEWAKNMNTCPVDRSVFRLILVRKGDRVVDQITVPAPGEAAEEGGEQAREEQEDLTYCEVCGRSDREDRLLLCDACDLGYHCECLSPPLQSVPIEEWYCPDCAPDHAPDEDESLSEGALEDFREMLASRFRPGSQPVGGLRRAIARTRASEIVRIRIQRRRAAVEHDGVASSPEHCTRRSRQSSRPLARPPSVRQRIAERLGDDPKKPCTLVCRLCRVRAALAKVSPAPACTDLLGSILEMQTVFHSKAGLAGVVVQRDGSLDLRAVPASVRKCPRSPPGSPAESPASPPPSSRGGHSGSSPHQPPPRRPSVGGGYASGYVGAGGDGDTPGRYGDDLAQRDGCGPGSHHHPAVPSPDAFARKNGSRERAKNGAVEEDDDIDIYSDIDDDSVGGDGVNHNGDDLEPSVNGESPIRASAATVARDEISRHAVAGVAEHEDEASSSENELVIDEQENAGEAPEDEAEERSKVAEESEEDGPILETDNVRSPSPDNDGDASQGSDEEGGLEIVENGNSSDGEEQDENSGGRENAEDGDKEEEEEDDDGTGDQASADEDESSQLEQPEGESGAAMVEDTPASPTEEATTPTPHAPMSPQAEDAPSPVEEAPSSPPIECVPASPTEDAAMPASSAESGEESPVSVSPVTALPEGTVAEPEEEQDEEGKEAPAAEATENDELEDVTDVTDDVPDDASSPKEIESPEAQQEEEEGAEQEEGLAVSGKAEDIASPMPETKEMEDSGVRNLLDSIGAEDITSPEEGEEEEEEGALCDSEEEEGLIEDGSNGMEDISEPGSTDGLVDNLEDIVREQEPWRSDQDRPEKASRKDRKSKHKKESCHHRKHRRHRRNSSDEDREEGEIVERSPSSSGRRRREPEPPPVDEFAELAPRINISELPRIPKLKRGDKTSHTACSDSSVGVEDQDAFMAVASHTEVKRTSVLGRVDSGGEISWKKLSKHSRDRSYRDGKPRDETVLFKDREIKKREKADRSENTTRKEARESSPSPPPSKKKERRPDRQLYVRPDKRDRHKKDKEKEKSSRKEKSSSSSSSSHKESSSHKGRKEKGKDKYKEKEKHGSSSSKGHGRHSSKDRRRSTSKEHRERRHSGRHHRDRSKERSVEKSSKQKESRRTDDHRESRHHGDREGKESRDKRESREARRAEEKIKVVVEKDYWRDKHERRKERSPSPFLEAEEHTPIESKEVIAKGDSIIINVNFNRSKKEPKLAPALPEEPAPRHHRSSARESRSRKREASSPVTPQYGSDSGADEGPIARKRHCRRPRSPDGGRSESEGSELDEDQEMERSPPYGFDDQASATSPSDSDDFGDRPSTPPEIHESPPSPIVDDKSPASPASSPATSLAPESSPSLMPPPIPQGGTIIQISPHSPPPPSPPSPPEDNSYDPCEPTKSPSPPPPVDMASEVDPCPPPEPELPPLPPEPEPPTRATVPAAVSSQAGPPPSVTAATIAGPTVLPTVAGVPQLQPPPPFLPSRPLTTVVGGLPAAWAPAATPVILGLRAPFVPPALGALVPPPMGLLPLRPPPPPMVRIATPAVVATPTAAVATTTSLPPSAGNNAWRAGSDRGCGHGRFDATDVLADGRPVFTTGAGRVPSLSGTAAEVASSRDSKHVVHFTVDKGKSSSSSGARSRSESKFGRNMDESQLQILDELPSSAVEMQVKDKFLKKLNRQERVVEEVKVALKPYYSRREVSKEEYKDILRKSVPKICHNKKGEINPIKIKAFIAGYVRKVKHNRKKLGSEQRHKAS
ncbi:hypothetical protein HPB48_003970 [Haemaphysalis longicornis]|uniref:PHD and RING finger domain-containing protein 1 n=1 Tax=Haemaphysalis longicornis TaxID=44386 RepID=A0A9J6GHI8_HAELO|nr:hypothetical protein HPB48_003970 [Haemaphysalis longicornis]